MLFGREQEHVAATHLVLDGHPRPGPENRRGRPQYFAATVRRAGGPLQARLLHSGAAQGGAAHRGNEDSPPRSRAGQPSRAPTRTANEFGAGARHRCRPAAGVNDAARRRLPYSTGLRRRVGVQGRPRDAVRRSRLGSRPAHHPPRRAYVKADGKARPRAPRGRETRSRGSDSGTLPRWRQQRRVRRRRRGQPARLAQVVGLTLTAAVWICMPRRRAGSAPAHLRRSRRPHPSCGASGRLQGAEGQKPSSTSPTFRSRFAIPNRARGTPTSTSRRHWAARIHSPCRQFHRIAGRPRTIDMVSSDRPCRRKTAASGGAGVTALEERMRVVDPDAASADIADLVADLGIDSRTGTARPGTTCRIGRKDIPCAAAGVAAATAASANAECHVRPP